MSTIEIVAIATVCMLATDIIATVEVQAEAAYKRKLAGLCDVIGWFVSITTTELSLRALDGHDTLRKILIYVCVGAANFYGTWLGVGIGAKLTRRKPGHMGPLTAAASRVADRDNGLKP